MQEPASVEELATQVVQAYQQEYPLYLLGVRQPCTTG